MRPHAQSRTGSQVRLPHSLGPLRDLPEESHRSNAHKCHNSLGRQPVANLCAFQIDSQVQLAPTRKYDDGSARILSVWRIDRHRRLRYVAHPHRKLACNQKFLSSCLSDLWPRNRLRIRRSPRPYRHLGMTRRWLPCSLLRSANATCKHDGKNEDRKVWSQSPQLIPVTAESKCCEQTIALIDPRTGGFERNRDFYAN